MVLDRLQVYWSGQIRGDKLSVTKKGGIILVGGAPESEKQFLGTIQTLEYMLGDLGAECVGIATMGGSDQKGLKDRPDMQEKIISLAEQLNC